MEIRAAIRSIWFFAIWGAGEANPCGQSQEMCIIIALSLTYCFDPIFAIMVKEIKKPKNKGAQDVV